MLEKELETAVKLARGAGEIILEFYANGFAVEEKIAADNSSEPVTAADRAASRLIVEGLAAAFPNDGILSEEEADDEARLEKRRVWIIDPIDGTRGFINRDGDFAVQIGLAAGDESVLGVVFLPAENRLYYAVKNAGAFLVEDYGGGGGGEPKRLRVSDETKFERMSVAVSRNHRSPKMSRIDDEFNFYTEMRRGSVGLKVGLIAERICDLYIHLSPRTKHWDTCAPEIILREAGGEMSDLFGAHIRYNAPEVRNLNGVLATNGAAHALALARLKPLLAEFGRAKAKL